MHVLPRLLRVLVLAFFPIPLAMAKEAAEPLTVASPDSHLRVSFRLGARGQPTIDAVYRDIPIASGALGLEFVGSGVLHENLTVTGVLRTSRDETYAIPVGKASSAIDRHNELVVSLEEKQPPHRKLSIALRAFDDGVAFRYLLPKQNSLAEFVLTDEHTRFTFPGDPRATILPLSSYTTSYEWYYDTKSVSDLRPDGLIGLPMLLEHPKKVWLAVTEANLTTVSRRMQKVSTTDMLRVVMPRAGGFAARLVKSVR